MPINWGQTFNGGGGGGGQAPQANSGSINWGGVFSNSSAPPPPILSDKRINAFRSSFNDLSDQSARNNVIKQLQQRVAKGDAKARLEYSSIADLVDIPAQPIQSAPAFRNPVLNTASNFAGSLAGNFAKGILGDGSAGEITGPQNHIMYAGQGQSVRDQAIGAVQSRLFFGGGGAALESAMGSGGVASRIGASALTNGGYGAASGALDSFRSDQAVGSAGTQLGHTFSAAAQGFGAGVLMGGGATGAGIAARAATDFARTASTPLSSATRVAATRSAADKNFLDLYAQHYKGKLENADEKAAAQWVIDNPSRAMQAYNARIKNEFGASNVVSGDEAKFIMPNFAADKSGVYHEPASALAKVKFDELLANPKTKEKPVLIMAGGSGAGKTSGLRNVGVSLKDYAAIVDTNSNKAQSVEANIQKALDSGRPVEVHYVYRDPVEAFHNGVVPRALRTQRIVPTDTHVSTHLGAHEVIQQITPKYESHPDVNVFHLDNSRGKGNAKYVSLDQLPKMGYSKEELATKIRGIVDEKHQSGEIPTTHRDTYLGSSREEQVSRQVNGDTARPGDKQSGNAKIKASAAMQEALDTYKATGSKEAAGDAYRKYLNDQGKLYGGVAKSQRYVESMIDYHTKSASHSPQEVVASSQKAVNAITKATKEIDQTLAANPAQEVVDQMAADRATMLKEADRATHGVNKVWSEDGKLISQSHNSPFYRKIYAEKKRPPNKAEYLEEAHRQLRTERSHEAIVYKDAIAATQKKKPAKVSAAIAENVDVGTLESPRLNNSTRSHHFDEALQETISKVEKSPGYEQELANRSGDKVVTNKEVYQAAKDAGPLDDKTILAAKPLDKVDTVTITRAHATVEAAARELHDLRQSGEEVTSATFQKAAERLGKLEAGYKIMTGEAGRATQIQGSFIDEATQLQRKIAKIVEETKGATEADRKTLIEKKIKTAEKESADALHSGKVFSRETVNNLMKIVAEYATAVKLTSPTTHIKNFGSNVVTLPFRAAEDTVKIGLQAARGETSLGQAKYVFGTTAGLMNATKQLAKDVASVTDLWGKDIESGTGKSELKPAIPGPVGKFVRIPFEFLSAADNFMKTIIRDSELHQQAYQTAYQEGFKGKAMQDRITELVTNPTEEMTAKADLTAKEHTFQSDTGPIASGITSILEKVPLGRLLIPFVKTPTNIAKYQIQRHPLGIFAPRNIKDVMKGGVPRDEAIARLTVGTGMALTGLLAVQKLGDNITGAAPTDPAQADAFYSQGRKPYAIKVDGHWVQYNWVQPVGMYVSQAVGLRDSMIKAQQTANKKGLSTDQIGQIFTGFVGTTAKALADLPFVSGVNNVVSALNDPTGAKVSKALGSPIAGLIPNISRDFATFGDNTSRQAKGVTDQVKLMIPGEREKVGERISVFGTPQKDASSGVERGFVKVSSKDNPSKLYQALQDAGYTPTAPQQKQRGKYLTNDQYAQFQKQSGQEFASKLQKAVSNSKWDNLSQDQQQKEIQGMSSDSRSDSLDSILGKTDKKKSYKRQFK